MAVQRHSELTMSMQLLACATVQQPHTPPTRITALTIEARNRARQQPLRHRYSSHQAGQV